MSEPPPYPVYHQDNPPYPQPDPNFSQQMRGPPPEHVGYSQQLQPGYPSHDASQTTVVYYQPMPTNTITVTTVDNNMACAILSCLFCFWPVGIFAIMNSCEVKPALLENDISKASRKAEQSRRLSKIALLVGIIICVVSAIIRIIIASA